MKWHLRPWELSDVPSIALYANDPAIAANLRNIFPYPYTRRDAEVFIGGCMAGDETLQLCRRSMGYCTYFRGNFRFQYWFPTGLGEEWISEGRDSASKHL